MDYHISDLRKYTRCHRSYLLEKADPEGRGVFQSYVRLDDEVSELAAEVLGITECFMGKRNDDPSLAMEALNTYEWL